MDYPGPRHRRSVDRAGNLTTLLAMLTETELRTLVVLAHHELEARSQASGGVEASQERLLAEVG